MSDELFWHTLFLRTGMLHNCYQDGKFSAQDVDNLLLTLNLLKIVIWYNDNK